MSSRGKKKKVSGGGSVAETRAAKPRSRAFKITALSLLCVFGTILLLGVLDVAVAFGTVYQWIHPEKVGWTESPMDVRLAYETFELDTPNGKVYGWIIPAQEPFSDEDEVWDGPEGYSDKTVVFASNYDSNREITDLGGTGLFVDFCRAGYNVVTFDWTGSGYSEGDSNAFLLDKTEELRAVVSYAQRETGASFLAVQGVGFGTYPAAVVTAQTAEVNALILDSCYGDFESVVFGNYGAWASFDFAPVRATAKLWFSLLTDADASSAVLSDVISNMSGKHILFIQGENDEVFGSSHIGSLVSLAKTQGKNTAEQWVVSGAGHLRVRSFDTEIYFSKISDFLKKAAPSAV